MIKNKTYILPSFIPVSFFVFFLIFQRLRHLDSFDHHTCHHISSLIANHHYWVQLIYNLKAYLMPCLQFRVDVFRILPLEPTILPMILLLKEFAMHVSNCLLQPIIVFELMEILQSAFFIILLLLHLIVYQFIRYVTDAFHILSMHFNRI